MAMTGPVLIAYDGSAPAATAVRAAGSFFPGGRAVVVRVRPDPITLEPASGLARMGVPDDVITGGLAALEQAAADEAAAVADAGARAAAEAGLDAEAAVATASGAAWRAIARVAEERDAAVVVCGSRGQGAFSRSVLGSTSSALVHRLDRPVLVIPDGGGAVDGPLVIGFDGSEGAADTIERVAALMPGREAIVVNVWDSPVRHTPESRVIGALPPEIRIPTRDFEEYFRQRAIDVAEQGAALAQRHGLEATAAEQESVGAGWRGLLAAGEAAGAGLLAVGSRGRGAVSSTLLGSFSSGLAHNAELPVLVVPSGAPGRETG
jgi:nucleotide-binding universal stress UspA family protein